MSNKIQIEDTIYQDKRQALNALAFCHYPVTVAVDGKSERFDSFDTAKDWIENQTK